VGLAIIPIVIWAHKFGPDPRHTGAPGDDTCNIPQCHVGTPLKSEPAHDRVFVERLTPATGGGGNPPTI
jgi:hypothetical protein